MVGSSGPRLVDKLLVTTTEFNTQSTRQHILSLLADGLGPLSFSAMALFFLCKKHWMVKLDWHYLSHGVLEKKLSDDIKGMLNHLT